MTKTDLVDAIAKSAGITKKAAGAALEARLDAITKDLKKGNNVVLTGFGTFRVSKRAARTGVNSRNPSEKIKIPAMKVAAFKAGKGASIFRLGFFIIVSVYHDGADPAPIKPPVPNRGPLHLHTSVLRRAIGAAVEEREMAKRDLIWRLLPPR